MRWKCRYDGNVKKKKKDNYIFNIFLDLIYFLLKQTKQTKKSIKFWGENS